MRKPNSKAPSLLIVAHTPSTNTKALAKAVLAGANDVQVTGVFAELCSPFDCDANKVLNSDAVILFTTENFGYMSGALKDFFERIYYPCLEQTKRNEGKPFAIVIRAGLDGTGAEVSLNKITSGLKWREVQELTLCKGDYKEEFEQKCYDLGLTIAASLENKLI